MIPLHKLHISFEELARRQVEILASQGPVTYQQALLQTLRIMSSNKHYKTPGLISQPVDKPESDQTL